MTTLSHLGNSGNARGFSVLCAAIYGFTLPVVLVAFSRTYLGRLYRVIRCTENVHSSHHAFDILRYVII
jgi:hypothetical protein